MPVLLGLKLNDLLSVGGAEVRPHPRGVYLQLQERRVVRMLWHTYYPYWQIPCSCLPAKLVGLLTRLNLTLAVAESCSGGGIASAITDIAGASSVFQGGVAAYTALAKSSLLGLQADELPPGCVGPNLTKRMAEQIRDRLQAGLGLAITGALGPKSPAGHISVGEVYIAVTGLEVSVVRKFNFSGDRQTIKKASIDAALNFLLTYIARWYVA